MHVSQGTQMEKDYSLTLTVAKDACFQPRILFCPKIPCQFSLPNEEFNKELKTIQSTN